MRVHENGGETRIQARNLGAHLRIFPPPDICFDVGVDNQMLPICEALAQGLANTVRQGKRECRLLAVRSFPRLGFLKTNQVGIIRSVCLSKDHDAKRFVFPHRFAQHLAERAGCQYDCALDLPARILLLTGTGDDIY